MKNNLISILFPLLILFILSCNQGCGDKAPTNSEDTTNTVKRDTVQPDVSGLVVANSTATVTEIVDEPIECLSSSQTQWSKCMVMNADALIAKQLIMCFQLFNSNPTDMVVDSVTLAINLPGYESTCNDKGAKNVTIQPNGFSPIYELEYCFQQDKTIEAGESIVVNIYAKGDVNPTSQSLTFCKSGSDACCH